MQRRDAWISVAAHTRDDVGQAVEEGADAVLVSPVFDTRGKRGRGVAAIREAREVVDAAHSKVAVLALGGVDADNAAVCVAAGADGVAVVRALLASADPYRVAGRLHDVLARRC
jgi:thiamine-phosphate pyrophosphorylase